MKNLRTLDRYRIYSPYHRSFGDESEGAFVVKSHASGKTLRMLASTGGGWDHVSVSYANKIPSWKDMEQVKRMFFEDDEVVMQLHVRPTEHISHHPYTLHLWRPHAATIPLPPDWMVGPRPSEGEAVHERAARDMGEQITSLIAELQTWQNRCLGALGLLSDDVLAGDLQRTAREMKELREALRAWFEMQSQANTHALYEAARKHFGAPWVDPEPETE
jgi:hypothetical protein